MTEAWVDVQRRWMYLEGVFQSPDLQTLLPQEAQRFKQIDTEYAVPEWIERWTFSRNVFFRFEGPGCRFREGTYRPKI